MERACENCSQKANPCWGTSEERHTCQFHTWKEAPLLEALAKARAALEAAGIEVEL